MHVMVLDIIMRGWLGRWVGGWLYPANPSSCPVAANGITILPPRTCLTIRPGLMVYSLVGPLSMMLAAILCWPATLPHASKLR